MDLLKSVRRRSFLSETLYVILNIVLAAAILVAVLVVNNPFPAFGLVLLSKWRVFAVRTRYWLANIRANLIDTIVGFSIVVLMYSASGHVTTQVLVALFYAVWLLFIKPRSKRVYVAAQAVVGLVLGLSAVVQLSPSWPVSVVVAASWIVAYGAARHILSVQHESHVNFLSLLWGFIVAEIMWLGYHWSIGYDVLGPLKLSQSVIIVTLLSFLSERVYSNYRRSGQIAVGDIVLPTLLSVSVILVLLFLFGGAVSI